MTDAEIIQAVCLFCETVTGTSFGTFYKSDGGGTPPTTAYGTVKMLGGQGTPVSSHVPDGSGGLSLRIATHERVSMSVQLFGAGAATWGRTIANKWPSLDSAAEATRALGLNPDTASRAESISRAVGTGSEPRWSMTLTGYHKSIESDTPVETVTSVAITTTIGGASFVTTVDTTGS